MSFNFAAAQKEALSDLANDKLGLLVLGQSGAGKSTLAGTFGVKTLYLYTTGERHGSKASKTFGGDSVIPICLDYANGAPLSADDTYQRLLDILVDSDGIKGQKFGAIVVDGATELETLVRATNKWRIMCLSKDGKHNSFAEGPSTLVLLRPIVDGLKTLQRQLGIHFMMTCILDVQAQASNGEVIESKPRLLTYNVAEGICQQFDDIIVVGPMSKGDDVAHRIQFLAGVTKESKDLAGNIKKTVNYTPRLTGIPRDALPKTVAADLKELIKLKTGK